jgi:hypothetical protein
MRVTAGPDFELLGLPALQTLADTSYGASGQVIVFDGRPGLQLYYSHEELTGTESRSHASRSFEVAADLKREVLTARKAIVRNGSRGVANSSR